MGFLKFAFPTNETIGFVNAPQIRYILANGSRVVWADESERLGPADIRWSLPDGTGATVVARAQTSVLGLAADDRNAYWLTGGPLAGTGPVDVAAAPLAGGAVLRLACGIQYATTALAVADDGVYVGSTAGVVWKIAKAP